MEKKTTPRKQQAAAMRDHIKKTAVGLFDQYGFANVSIEEIAQAAGCSVGNIYHYFKSKDELSLQVTDHVDELYGQLEQQYAADPTRSAKEKLLDFVGKSLVISVQEDVLYKSFVHAMSFPEQGLLKYKKDRVWFRMLRDFITVCKQEGSIPETYPDDEILHALVVIHRGTLMQYRIEEGNFPLESRGRSMARAYLDGLR